MQTHFMRIFFVWTLSTLAIMASAQPFSGSYNVGTGQTYTTLTGAGGFFQAINGGTVAGNITLHITSNLTEDGTNALNAWVETGIGGYTMTIAPANATTVTVSGNVLG